MMITMIIDTHFYGPANIFNDLKLYKFYMFVWMYLHIKHLEVAMSSTPQNFNTIA